jgi:hypothetical protein
MGQRKGNVVACPIWQRPLTRLSGCFARSVSLMVSQGGQRTGLPAFRTR